MAEAHRHNISLDDVAHGKLSEQSRALGLTNVNLIRRWLDTPPGQSTGSVQFDTSKIDQFEKSLTEKIDDFSKTLKQFESVLSHDILGSFDHLKECKPCIDKVTSAGFKVAYDPKADTRQKTE